MRRRGDEHGEKRGLTMPRCLIHKLDKEPFSISFRQPMKRGERGVLIQAIFQPTDRRTIKTATCGNVRET